MKHNFKKESGFTMLELFFVTIVMGIILAIAVPSYLNYMTSARENASTADLKIIGAALKLYRLDNGSWPINFDLLSPNYLNEIPKDRFNPKNYYQYSTPDSTTALIWSVGKNARTDGSYNSGTINFAGDDIGLKIQ